MKVTQVLYSGKGGHGSVAHSLIDADAEKAFEHGLIYFGIEAMDADYIAFCQQRNISFIAIRKTQGRHFKSWKIYLKALKQQQPDRILLHSMTLVLPTLWHCLFHKAKWVAVEHQSNQFKRKSEWIWSFFALLFAWKIVYLTESYRSEIFQKMGFIARKKNVSIIPNGIDTGYFSPGKPIASTAFKIGMASRINALRDHQTLVKAFETLAEKHPTIELHIAGDGEGMKNLQKQVAASKFRASIFLHGNLGNPDLLSFLQNLDLYVHSTFAETMSTSILQAMGVGLPVVVSNIPGTSSLFQDGTEGFFFQSGDATDLASKMEALLQNENLREQMGKKARKKAVDFHDSKAMFAQYRSLLEK